LSCGQSLGLVSGLWPDIDGPKGTWARRGGETRCGTPHFRVSSRENRAVLVAAAGIVAPTAFGRLGACFNNGRVKLTRLNSMANLENPNDFGNFLSALAA